ncbi:MAG: tRNA (adenosine(37)-N6)-threonylcarbamoyltransferase complex ATPase subunit type 1 TsaE [Deltaproteobacteria bacterium]|nr:tRNA (adenosine(37)-N6)-threonylcarbamoyltransferase complex ATPase subunit type 1 TsaE [Deltaproteobacteria bacterium]
MRVVTLYTDNEHDTFRMGVAMGELCEAGDILALWGELGAGKTLLTRGVARGLGIPAHIPITSPTFTFINEYDGRLHLYHLDLYRISHPDELETLPWKECLFGGGVAVIEWPDRLGDQLPRERWDVRIVVTGDENRTIQLEGHGERQEGRLERWADRCQEKRPIPSV